MDPNTIRQLRGVNDLLQDAVDAGARAMGEAHQEIARQQYALLKRFLVIGPPVSAIERVHQTMMIGFYQSIRALNRAGGSLAAQGLNWLEQCEPRRHL